MALDLDGSAAAFTGAPVNAAALHGVSASGSGERSHGRDCLPMAAENLGRCWLVAGPLV